MWDRWWRLPGPALFVDGIVRDLRSGRNAVIGLPEHPSPGLAAAVQEALAQDEFITWRAPPVQALRPQEDPLVFLGRMYATDIHESDLRSVSSLVASDRFVGHVVWVEGLAAARWPSWRGFLGEYAEAIRRRPAAERGLVCVSLVGHAEDSLPAEDVALGVHRWTNRLGVMDLLGWLYLHTRPEHRPSPVESRLRMGLGLELIGFDATLAPRVATLDLETLNFPRSWLQGVARERGWLKGTVPAWRTGTSDRFEGRALVHPALLAVEDAGDALLANRLWRAQVGVLLPFIEEQRAWFGDQYGDLLKMPFHTSRGDTIVHPDELEIGHLCHLLRPRVSDRERRHLVRLRDARNALAHREALSAEELLALLEGVLG